MLLEGGSRATPGDPEPPNLTSWLDPGPVLESRHPLRQRLDGVDRVVSGVFELAITLPRSDRYRTLATAIAPSLEATFFGLAVQDGANRLVIRAWGGPRPPSDGGVGVALSLARLSHCAKALEAARAVTLDFGRPEMASTPERELLFASRARAGLILPFRGRGLKGALLIAEERHAGRQPLPPERIAVLEFVARRVGDILDFSDRLEEGRSVDARRDRRSTESAERRRLARELHDEVGQALTALLIRLRWAMAQARVEPEELRIFETNAQRALDATRALAYDLRRGDDESDPIAEARRYAEHVLGAARCRLRWTDQREDTTVSQSVSRELAHVIRESVTNVVRHAQASLVKIRLEAPDGLIRVSIQDNGMGFVPQAVFPGRSGGLGLLGNAERLRHVRGRFQVESAPGAGSLVVAEAPRA